MARSLRQFFSDYLPAIRGVSPHTIQSYRDTVVLLLRFVAQAKQLDPVRLELTDLLPEDVLAFLKHLETERHNKTSTRNVRLAAKLLWPSEPDPARLANITREFGIEFAL